MDFILSHQANEEEKTAAYNIVVVSGFWIGQCQHSHQGVSIPGEQPKIRYSETWRHLSEVLFFFFFMYTNAMLRTKLEIVFHHINLKMFYVTGESGRHVKCILSPYI